jgi:uncharacterized protein (DUF302 family)
MTYGSTMRLPVPFGEAVDRVRAALAAQGFGVLTEIDVRATMKNKLDADMEDYVILGACNPPLAHQALDADRSVGLLLPCNVVVRAAGDEESIVEMLDPAVMSTLSDAPGVGEVAADASRRLQAARDAIDTGAASG